MPTAIIILTKIKVIIMRHGFSDDFDNGWGDIIETRPETAEETAARHAYVDAKEAERASRQALQDKAFAAIKAVGGDPAKVMPVFRSSGAFLVKRLFGDAVYAVVADKNICASGWDF
jgi:hypothetical protein